MKKGAKYVPKIEKAKLAARSELTLKAWSKHGYHLTPSLSAQSLGWVKQQNIDRIQVSHTSKEEFIQSYEEPGIPCILVGAMEHWPAYSPEDGNCWTIENLTCRHHHERFKIGQDDDGKAVFLPLTAFSYYCTREGLADQDDSPLYIFDSGFGDRRHNNTGKSTYNPKQPPPIKEHFDPGESQPCSLLTNDYTIPYYFAGEDLFDLTAASRRPPFRWVVWGPARSGSWIHTDPLGTSAWNALISGQKRWALFPPGTPVHMIDPPRRKGEDREASSWFTRVLPTLTHPSTLDSRGQTLAQRLGMRELIQGPGEVVFVPSGWHHVVINVSMTIAVTHNFASLMNVEAVWLATRNARPTFARHWIRMLRRKARDEKVDLKARDQYRNALRRIHTLKMVPALPESSSEDGDSDSTTLSDSSGVLDVWDDVEREIKSDTEETLFAAPRIEEPEQAFLRAIRKQDGERMKSAKRRKLSGKRSGDAEEATCKQDKPKKKKIM